MIRARLLVWMIAVVALLVPPVVVAHAMAPAGQAASVDCPGHAPPPDPCPDHGSAKHAASACCSLMAGTMALLPPAVDPGASISFRPPFPAPARHLSGLGFSQDPPPPRA
jgi:hypothetical protein